MLLQKRDIVYPQCNGRCVSTRVVANFRKFLACPADYRAADDRGLSMHIVSDYANVRAFVLLGPTPACCQLDSYIICTRSFAS